MGGMLPPSFGINTDNRCRGDAKTTTGCGIVRETDKRVQSIERLQVTRALKAGRKTKIN